MKPFYLNSIVNTLALRPSVIELRAHRVALPGVLSLEPLVRGCDQREWLERLIMQGIRHLILPLNCSAEDTCVFARSHPTESGGAALYDLNHRDEGFFSRLQFLFESADATGVLIGLSLFSADSGQDGPLKKSGNAQGISLKDSLASERVADEPSAILQEPIVAPMLLATEWISAAMRGRPGVWAEIFRREPSKPKRLTRERRVAAERERQATDRLEEHLAVRLAGSLTKPGEDPVKARMGPWVVIPAVSEAGVHRAPFGVRDDCALDSFPLTFSENPSITPEKTPVIVNAPAPATHRVAFLRHFFSPGRPGAKIRWPKRSDLWRSVFRGCWPVVPIGPIDQISRQHWKDLAQIATFGRQWVGQGYLRACPEMLEPMSAARIDADKISAATDGWGRYFVYSGNGVGKGLDLTILAGTYRYLWFDPRNGKGLDIGEGLEGGTRCRIPGPGVAREALLILEQEEFPDPNSVW